MSEKPPQEASQPETGAPLAPPTEVAQGAVHERPLSELTKDELIDQAAGDDPFGAADAIVELNNRLIATGSSNEFQERARQRYAERIKAIRTLREGSRDSAPAEVSQPALETQPETSGIPKRPDDHTVPIQSRGNRRATAPQTTVPQRTSLADRLKTTHDSGGSDQPTTEMPPQTQRPELSFTDRLRLQSLAVRTSPDSNDTGLKDLLAQVIRRPDGTFVAPDGQIIDRGILHDALGVHVRHRQEPQDTRPPRRVAEDPSTDYTEFGQFRSPRNQAEQLGNLLVITGKRYEEHLRNELTEAGVTDRDQQNQMIKRTMDENARTYLDMLGDLKFDERRGAFLMPDLSVVEGMSSEDIVNRMNELGGRLVGSGAITQRQFDALQKRVSAQINKDGVDHRQWDVRMRRKVQRAARSTGRAAGRQARRVGDRMREWWEESKNPNDPPSSSGGASGGGSGGSNPTATTQGQTSPRSAMDRSEAVDPSSGIFDMYGAPVSVVGIGKNPFERESSSAPTTSAERSAAANVKPVDRARAALAEAFRGVRESEFIRSLLSDVMRDPEVQSRLREAVMQRGETVGAQVAKTAPVIGRSALSSLIGMLESSSERNQPSRRSPRIA